MKFAAPHPAFTIRDRFAMAILNGLLSDPRRGPNIGYIGLVKLAYEVADIALEEGEKAPPSDPEVPMPTVEQHNTLAYAASAPLQPLGAGVLCPLCRVEMEFYGIGVCASIPPKREVRCPKCSKHDYMIV